MLQLNLGSNKNRMAGYINIGKYAREADVFCEVIK